MNDTVPIGIDGYYALCFKNNKCKTEFDIQTKFSTFGRVISVRKVGSENGIVFVRYKKQSEANACFAALRNDHVYRVEIPRRTKGKGDRKGGSKRNKQQQRGPVHNQPYRTYSGVPEQDLHGGRKPYVHSEPQSRTKDTRREKNIKFEEKSATQSGGSTRRKDNRKEKAANVERERTGWSSPNTQHINVQHTGSHSKRRGKMGGAVEEYYQGWPPLKQDQRLSRGKHSSVSEDEETAYGSPEPCTEATIAAELSPWEESDDNFEQPVMSPSQAEADDASHLVEDEGACSLAIINKQNTEIANATPVRTDYGGWPPPSPHGEGGVVKTEAPTGNVDELERLKFLTLGTPGPRADTYEPFGGLEKCWSRSPQWEPSNETQNPVRSSSAAGYGICDVSSSVLCQHHLVAYGRAHTLVNLDQARAVVFPSDYYSACHSFYEEEEH